MNYLVAISGIVIGFALGVLAIARVSVRPEIKKVLRNYKIIKGHKARIPKPRLAQEDRENLYI